MLGAIDRPPGVTADGTRTPSTIELRAVALGIGNIIALSSGHCRTGVSREPRPTSGWRVARRD
jgi:hypothetical protein